MKVTEQDVFNAADELFAEGINPTNAKVRKKIGRGSYSDITVHLKKWKESNNSRDYINNVESMPNDVREIGIDYFRSFMDRVWLAAIDKAQELIKGEWFALLETENQQLKEEIMHYKEMEIELKTLKAYQQDFEKKFENRIKELENHRNNTTQLSNCETDLKIENSQNK